MILYLDTSSLVKLYVEEPGSGEVRRLAERAELVGSSVVAYPEARAAFARRRRERSLTGAAHQRVATAFDADWPHVLALEVSDPLARSAGDLAERHRLRGFDAVHLATYLDLALEFPDETVHFSSADRSLARAAAHARGKRGDSRRPTKRKRTAR